MHEMTGLHYQQIYRLSVTTLLIHTSSPLMHNADYAPNPDFSKFIASSYNPLPIHTTNVSKPIPKSITSSLNATS